MAKTHKLSLRMRLVERLLWRTKAKNFLVENYEQKILDFANKLKRHSPRKSIPCWVFRHFEVTEKNYQGSACYFLKNKRTLPNNYLIYLHGGAYYLPIVRLQWNFIARLAELTDSFVYVPMYPLAPENQYPSTPPFLEAFYLDLCKQNQHHLPINIIGDSAGGGIALSFVQMIRNQGWPQAQKVVLLSPRVDMTPMTKDEEKLAKEIDKIDCMLSLNLYDVVRKWWCGKNDYRNYFASPIYGGLHNLNEIWVFSGTADLLNIVAHRLQKQAEKENVTINYVERENMPHVWMILINTPEGKCELMNIAKIFGSGHVTTKDFKW